MARATAAAKSAAPNKTAGRPTTGRGGALAPATIPIDLSRTRIEGEFPQARASRSPWRAQLDSLVTAFDNDALALGEFVQIGQFNNKTSAGKQVRRYRNGAATLCPVLSEGCAWQFKTVHYAIGTSELWAAIVEDDGADTDVDGER